MPSEETHQHMSSMIMPPRENLYRLAKAAVLRKINVMGGFFMEGPAELLRKSIGCVCTSCAPM